jgi:peptidoglycan/xylan/chitin deacetylase (PgdA/CDA1 family)
MFDHYGARITFFIQGSLEQDRNVSLLQISYIPDHPAGEIDLLNFCFEALRRGHSLGFHTVNHLDLRGVSRETFYMETIGAADAFFRMGIPFSGFAYPFGFSHPWMHEMLAPVFNITRGYGVNARFYTAETISEFIFSKAVDNIIYPDINKFENDIRLLMFIAKFTNSIIPFTSHDISYGIQWGIEPSRLEFLLKTAQELGMKFYTYCDFSVGR